MTSLELRIMKEKPLDEIDVNFRRPEIGGRSLVFANAEEPPFALSGRECRDACTVDGCHPNDLGFFRMAQTFSPSCNRH